MKKAVISVFIILLALAGGAYWWFTTQNKQEAANPIDAIPTSAAIVISYPEITKAWETFESQAYFKVFREIKELNLFFAKNQMLDSLIRNDQDLSEMLAKSVVWSSYHSNGSDSIHVFYAIKPNNATDKKSVKSLNTAMASVGVVTESVKDEMTTYKLVVAEPYNVLYYTGYRGLLLASSSNQLLNESINQLKSGKSLNSDPEFAKAIEATGQNVEANYLVNYKKLPTYFSGILKPTIGSFNGLVSSIGSWTELDLHLKPEGLTFNGFTYTSDTLNQYLKLFLDQEPQTITFPEYLPSSTASFLFFGIDDAFSFTTDYKKLLQNSGRLVQLATKLDSLNTHFEIDLEQNLLAWMGNSFGICVTESQETSFGENTFMVFEARSADLAAKLLNELSDGLSAKNKLDVVEIENNGVLIRQLPLGGILTDLFGDGFDAYENPFYMIIGNRVVFGTNQESMASYLRFIQGDRTLGKELSFSRFIENLGSTYNVFSYNQLARSKSIFESYLDKDASASLVNNPQIAANFEALGTQVSTTGKSFYSNVFLNYNPNWSKAKESSWTATLDGAPIGAPTVVKNHLTGESEFLIQDVNKMLYLFNKMGQPLFKVPLVESIQNKPIQVDAFGNGKLQYIFNTKNYVYLIDRNGDNIEGFPFKLPAEAETDLSVFDYDKSKNYRLLISCKNKHIYNYDINGKEVSGWKHTLSSNPTTQQFKHFVVGGKDYIVTGESNGKIHLLDRQGKNRVTVEQRVVASKNNQLQTLKSSESAFSGVYLTDKEGKIYRVSLDGEVKDMDLGKFSPEHRFFVSDLDKDGGPEFIFSDLNVLQIFNYKKEKVAEHRLEPSASEPFLIDLGKGGVGIGYYYKDSEQLVLFDSSGQMVDGFPMSGNSEYVLVKEGDTRLVVSAGSGTELVIQAIP